MAVAVTKGGGGDDTRKKKKRPPPVPSGAAGLSGPSPAPAASPPPAYADRVLSGTEKSLSLVEKASRAKLPPALSYSLATLDLTDWDKRRAARIAARDLDLPPSFLWNDKQIAKMEDPLYGGQMRMSTLNRIMEGFEPSLLQAMLPTFIQGETTLTGQVRGKGYLVPEQVVPKASAVGIAKTLRDTAASMDELDLTAAEGFALAVSIERNRVPRKAFAQNLQVLLDYNESTKGGVYRAGKVVETERFERDQIVGIAVEAAKRKVTFGTSLDVVGFLSPALAAEAERFVSNEQQDAEMTSPEQMQTIPTRAVAVGTTKPVHPVGAEARFAIHELAFAKSGENYFEASKAIEEQMQAADSAWENSFLGKNIGRLFGAWNQAQVEIEQGIVSIATPIIGAEREIMQRLGHELELPVTGQDLSNVDAGWEAAFKFRDERFQDFARGQHLGTQFTEDQGLPEWMGFGLDFALGIFLDPTILAGRAITVLRAGRVLPGLADKTTLLRTVGSKVTAGRISTTRVMSNWETYVASANAFIGRKTGGRMLFNSLMKDVATQGDNLDNYIGAYSKKFVDNLVAQSPFEPTLMNNLGKRIMDGVRSGSITKAQAWDEFADGMRVQFIGGKVRPGSIVGDTLLARQLDDARLVESSRRELMQYGGRSYTSSESGLAVPETTAAGLADDVIAANTAPVTMQPIRFEVPTRIYPVPGLGATRYAVRTAKQSDSTLARAVVSPTEFVPRNTFRVHEDPYAQFDRMGRDFGAKVFSASDLRAQQQQVSKLIGSGMGYEKNLINLWQETYAKGALKYMTMKKLPTDIADNLISELKGVHSQFNARRTFGIVDERTSIPSPLLETQLVNEFYFVQPSQIKELVDRYTGTVQALRRQMSKAGLDVNLGKQAGIFDAIDRGRTIWSTLVRGWKFSVVPRPGYIGRVILGDENLRFLATTGSLFERMAATNIEDATSALMRGFVTAPGVVTTPKAVAGAVGRASDTTIGKVLDTLWPDEVHVIRNSDNTISELRRARPGRWDDEIYANTNWRETEILDDVIANQKFLERMARSEHYGRVIEGDAHYYQTWSHNLKDQLGFSAPGQEALASVVRGEDIATTAERLRGYITNPMNRAVRSRIAIPDVDQWADDLARLTHAYTVSNPAIARMALRRADGLEDALKALPKEVVRPAQHGPLLASMAKGNNPLTRYVDYWYNVFVRQPENVLNRQPYYKVWKNRAEESMMSLAKGPIDDAMREAIDQSSREFALAQVKRIMFDFSDSTRFGEAIGFFVPFMQPWLEAYSVWGHIITRRNPAVIGYAHQLGRLGLESGFLRRDPASGELMVPTSWWMSQSIIYDFLAKTKGTATFTPLSSLNLFFSSTVKMPTEGPLGKVFGGVEIPVPSLSPWAGAIGKQLFKDSQSEALASYLFAFGPDTPLLPPSWSKIAESAFPELYDDRMLGTWQQRLADEWQRSGLLEQRRQELLDDGLPPDQVADTIEAEIKARARWMLLANGALSLFQLGATQVNLPYKELENEFFAKLDELDDFGKTVDWWNEKYQNKDGSPRYPLIPTGGTTFAGVIKDPNTGAIVYDPKTGEPLRMGFRIPASELANKFINLDDNMRKTFKNYPELFGALMLSLDEEKANEYDFAMFSQLVRQGVIERKDIGEYIADGEQAGFWEAVDRFYTPQRDHREEKLDQESLAYKEMQQDEQFFLSTLYSQYPFYAPSVLAFDTQNQTAQWAYGSADGLPTDRIVMGKLRAFKDIEGLQDFAVVKALDIYFNGTDKIMGRDEIKNEMSRHGITNLDTVAAEDAGLKQQYDKLLKAMEDVFPQGVGTLKGLIGNDLTDVPDMWERRLNNWAEKTPQRYAAYKSFDKEYFKLDNPPEGQEKDWDSIRDLMNEQMKTKAGRENLDVWWGLKGYQGQKEFEQNLVTLPVTFYSRFDFKVMGLDMSNQEAKAYQEIQSFRSQEEARQDEANANRRVYDVDFDRINAMTDKALDRFGKHSGFAKAVNAVNEWGWTLRAQKLDEQPGRLGKTWGIVFKAVTEAQRWAIAQDINGYHRFVSDEDLANWKGAQAWLEEGVKDYIKAVPAFGRQWQEMDDDYWDGSLYTLLMPDTWFPTGTWRP